MKAAPSILVDIELKGSNEKLVSICNWFVLKQLLGAREIAQQVEMLAAQA